MSLDFILGSFKIQFGTMGDLSEFHPAETNWQFTAGLIINSRSTRPYATLCKVSASKLLRASRASGAKFRANMQNFK